MLRDIYAIPNSEGRYKPGIVELNNELDEILQQVDCLLFTRKGEVLMISSLRIPSKKRQLIIKISHFHRKNRPDNEAVLYYFNS